MHQRIVAREAAHRAPARGLHGGREACVGEQLALEERRRALAAGVEGREPQRHVLGLLDEGGGMQPHW